MNNHKAQPIALMTASVASMIDSFNMDNIRILKQLGYKVHVAANFESGNPSVEGIETFKKELEALDVTYFHIPTPRDPMDLPAVLESYRHMVSLIQEWNYTLVHCHSPVGGVIARLACRKARRRGTRVLYTAHGFHFFKGAPIQNWLLFYPAEWLCSWFTDILITINQEDFLRAKNFHAKKVVYIPGVGVETEKIRNVQVERYEKRRQLGYSDGEFVFASVGELSHRKNHEVAVRALSKVKFPFAKCLIVGDGALKQSLNQLVKELNIEDRVAFAGYRNDVKELLHAVDAFVFPSLQEGLPVALMEAMSVGLPIVCSQIRGNVDLIEDGVGGYLVAPCDVDGFSAAMEKIISGEGAQMGAANIDTMRNFDISTVNAKMDTIYRDAVEI